MFPNGVASEPTIGGASRSWGCFALARPATDHPANVRRRLATDIISAPASLTDQAPWVLVAGEALIAP